MRAVSNELSAGELNEFHRLLENDPAARQEYRRMKRLAGAVGTSARRSFGPGFSDRVMERLGRKSERRQYSFADLLAPMFYRVAGAALAIAVTIGVYNVTLSSGADQSPIEAALGLPSTTVESAYDAALRSLAMEEEAK